MTSKNKWHFWIDRGGTFTDIVATAPDGSLSTLKLLSENKEFYEDASIEGMRRLLEVPAGAPFPAEKVGAIRMGTTVATNALLERRGEPTVFVVTQGFRDLIEIGDQRRPDLFALEIKKPQPLYGCVIEAHERVAAKGEIVRTLDEMNLKASLKAAFDDGYRAVAIAFLHGYRFPDHELAAAEIARQAGFESITTSHRTIPLMKVVPRAETAVADAYLSPVLNRYIQRIKSEVGGGRLYFMRSSGGLAPADEFAGKDAVLSGPAGGVVGAAAVGAATGYKKIIGFDMGGTSTDVAHFAGVYERVHENRVAGVRLKVPMLDINTVAAGGGSICRFDKGRYRVGPGSAGANPGPACYGRGGPLTITDCNLLLGRLEPARFPNVFGSNGNEPLNAAAARDAATRLAGQIETASGRRADLETVAEGFLEVAIEHMCRAIRRVSIERGHDVSAHALVAFGGAGGQHACRIAERLGIGVVIIHPEAGLLSALGIGLAPQGAMADQALELPLDQKHKKEILKAASDVKQRACATLEEHGLSRNEIELRCHLEIKYRGSDTTLSVAEGAFSEVRTTFEDVHKTRFGFIDPGRELIVEAVSAEATGGGQSLAASSFPRSPAGPAQKTRFFAEEGWREAPQLESAGLEAGAKVEGPAMIVDPHATTIVEPGWSVHSHPSGNLVLRRAVNVEKRGFSAELDPILLEVFNHRFMGLAEEMGGVLEMTAHSVNIKERLDFSCAIFDGEGGLVANAPHMPVHLGSMGESVATIARRNTGKMRIGDAYLLNDPYNGGTHLPDVTVVMPIFLAGASPSFFVASRGHHADIGGIRPGSMPASSKNISQEGILFDNLLILRDGAFAEASLLEALKSGPYPARNPDQNIADVKAQLAACEKGAQEAQALSEEFGLATVRAYMDHVQENATAAVRSVLSRLTDGECEYDLDQGLKVRVEVRLHEDKTAATIDFTGTSPQHSGNFNAPLAVTRAAVLYALRTLVADDIPLNDGCLKPITLIVPKGCFLNPLPPAAVVAGNVETSQAVTNALLLAMGGAAASQGTMNNFTFGDAEHQYYETISGGAGAGPGFDGASAVQVHMTNSKLTDPEVLEWRFPVMIEKFERRLGSGGAGMWRGGDGVRREIRFLKEMEISILSGHRLKGPPGLNGGRTGSPGKNLIKRLSGDCEALPGAAEATVKAGEIVVIETPGGGGCDSAATKEPNDYAETA
jgi:5-oxoprolinase (ATP-hydrolysing)